MPISGFLVKYQLKADRKCGHEQGIREAHLVADKEVAEGQVGIDHLDSLLKLVKAVLEGARVAWHPAEHLACHMLGDRYHTALNVVHPSVNLSLLCGSLPISELGIAPGQIARNGQRIADNSAICSVLKNGEAPGCGLGLRLGGIVDQCEVLSAHELGNEADQRCRLLRLLLSVKFLQEDNEQKIWLDYNFFLSPLKQVTSKRVYQKIKERGLY